MTAYDEQSGAIRHTRDNPCEVCGGHDGDKRGIGERCYGFTSGDGRWCFCTREEYAGALQPTGAGDDLYRHALFGVCRCGESHDGAGTAREEASESAQYNRRVTRYDIRLANGEVAATHVRVDFTTADGAAGKAVWWETRGRRGLTMKVRELPLYDMPTLLKAPFGARVYLVEGEKARDALWLKGILAVATVTGAGQIPCDARLAPLCDYEVVLWPDHDDLGQQHMQRIADRLTALGAPPIGQVVWPDAPAKGDAADYIAQGCTETELAQLVQPLEAGTALRILTRAEMEALPSPEWVIDGLLQRPTLGIVFGSAASFKTTGVVGLCACIASGQTEWLGLPLRDSGPVLYLAGEDPAGVRQRLRAWEQQYAQGIPTLAFHLADGIPHLAEPQHVDQCVEIVARDERHYAVIVLDTLTEAMVGCGQDKAEDMSLALTAARRFQEFADIVLIVHHTGWSDDAAYRPRGSSTLAGTAETLILFKADGEAVTLAVTKQKNGPSNRSCILQAQTVTVPTAADPEAASVVLTGSALGLLDAATTMSFKKKSGRPSQIAVDDILPYLTDGMSHGEWRGAVLDAGVCGEYTFNKLLREATKGALQRVVLRDGKYHHLAPHEQQVDLSDVQ